MAIRDLLWACPLCLTVSGIRAAGRRERCVGCGALFRRGRGASIVVTHDERVLVRSAEEWLRPLSDLPLPAPAADGVILGPEPVVVRLADRHRPLRNGAELLGWIEQFGPRTTGRLSLTTDQLRFVPEPPRQSERTGPIFPLRTISAVQPSSSALQIAAQRTVASFRFTHGSVRLWSRAITTQLRRLYAADGLDITQFQPCIRTCAAARTTHDA